MSYLLLPFRWIKHLLDKLISAQNREWLHTVIFKSDTKPGRLFDKILFIIILFSVIDVILESVTHVHTNYWWLCNILEWVFTFIFTIEYILRLYASKQPIKYATSFFGVVDLLAILPAFISFIFGGAQNLMVIRALRLIRIFRIFKMRHFVKEGEVILSALKASRSKIYVFVSFVIIMALIIGTVLYIVEGETNPQFSNIPKGIYWAIVTLTTVGYGDVVPITSMGQFLSTIVMILGYGVIAVPTGIVTAEISGRIFNHTSFMVKECPICNEDQHHPKAKVCHQCGNNLAEEKI